MTKDFMNMANLNLHCLKQHLRYANNLCKQELYVDEIIPQGSDTVTLLDVINSCYSQN